MKLLTIASLAALAACTQSPQSAPATQIQVQRDVVEVQRPCRVVAPARPAPLARPLPDDAERLNALLTAKLLEYAGPGRYADRIEAALAECVGK